MAIFHPDKNHADTLRSWQILWSLLEEGTGRVVCRLHNSGMRTRGRELPCLARWAEVWAVGEVPICILKSPRVKKGQLSIGNEVKRMVLSAEKEN